MFFFVCSMYLNILFMFFIFCFRFISIAENYIYICIYCHGSVCPPTQPIIIIITRPHLISPEPQSSAPAPYLILITPILHKHQHQSTSSSSLVQSRSDTIGLTLSVLPIDCALLLKLLTLCVIPSVLSLSSVLLIILPSSSTSPGFPAVVSIHDLLELKNTTGLICSSPVEVSSYPLLTCFLLFIWILSINVTN